MKSWRCRDRRRVRQAEGWIAVIQYLPRNFFRCSALPLSFAFSSSTPSQSTEPLTPLLPSSATAAAPRAVALTTVYTPRRIAQICIGNGIAACAVRCAQAPPSIAFTSNVRLPPSLFPSLVVGRIRESALHPLSSVFPTADRSESELFKQLLVYEVILKQLLRGRCGYPLSTLS